MKRERILFYSDWLAHLSTLENEEIGTIIKAIAKYVLEHKKDNSINENIYLKNMVEKIESDQKAYQKYLERVGRKNG